jgi:UDP-N-acetylmuramoyl-tripeptide--D-alanyl-D-alanine ligase
VLYRLSDLPALLRTPVGRAKVREACYCHAWPATFHLAGAYRRRVIRRTRIVAVVGSFGKTTTTRAVTAALGRPTEPSVNRNFSSYLAEVLLRVQRDDRHAVLEVGIGHPGEMERYARLLRPDLAVVTSVGSEHNRYLGNLESTRAQKVQMVRALPRSGLAVLNWDDPNVRWMADQTRARVRTFGLGPDCEVRASEVVLEWPRGTRFRLQAGGRTEQVRTRLLGKPMVYALLAAVAVGLGAGVPFDTLLPRLEALGPTPGRLEVVGLANGALLLRDDFKSTVETVDAALDLLAEVPAERRLVVLGEIDDPPLGSTTEYQRLGERVGRLAARAVIVGSEDCFRQYAAGAKLAGLEAPALFQAGPSVRPAIDLLRQDLRPGDVVLIKGRWGQRLDRVTLALSGQQVGCEITSCSARAARCAACPMLARGWGGLRVVT